ncbi:MAG: PQQ-binding-like beta-propeller repeat protein [Holosporaceae bacterium]|jgi:outer membrane protein assembly factor BamB|nr:PQQ-binding-like beta-propeller repeat protein [Holosporaceae bacterium]
MKKNKYIAFFILGTLLAGCSSKDQLKGKREELIISEYDEDMIKTVDRSPVIVDSGNENNSEFTQPHFNPEHCYAPLKFSLAPQKIWSSALDFETSESIKMTAAPVVAEGKVFCMDAAGIVYAFDQKIGKRLWRKSTTLVGKDGQIGGAIAYDAGCLIVTSSFAEGFCLNAKDGNILWRIKLPAACKGDGITVRNGKAFLMCSNSSLHCINLANGKTLWSHSGMLTDSTFVGSSSVAISDGIVCFAYPSGEVFALLEETGTVLWDAMLSKFSLTNAARAFSHPRACPIVKDGVVYLAAANEQTSAFDIKSGKLLWRSDYGGIQTPVVNGNSIFIFNSKSELICLNRNTGHKRWAKKLTHKEDRLVDWSGMIPVKDHILVLSPIGYMQFVSMCDGKINKTIFIDEGSSGISVNPVIAGGTMYVPTNSGKLVAYR